MFLLQPYMPYQDIVLFIRTSLERLGDFGKLPKNDFLRYKKSVENNLFVEILLEHYMPYRKKWEALLKISNPGANSITKKGVHDAMFIEKRAKAKDWLYNTYPHSYDKEQLYRECCNILDEIGHQIASGVHDRTLEFQEKEREITKEEENAKNQNRSFNENNVRRNLTDIGTIKKEFATYLDTLKEELRYQTFSVNEIACLYQWIMSGEDSGHVHKWAAIVEALDESRTAYFDGGSFRGKIYSCPQGVAERILDRVFSIMESITTTETPKRKATQEFIDHFVRAFIEKDKHTGAIIASDLLYQAYLQAQNLRISQERIKKWVRVESEDSERYQNAQDSYIKHKIAKIHASWETYQSTSDKLAKRSLESLLSQYLHSNHGSKELLPPPLLQEKLESDFRSKLALIEEDFDYAAILKDDWLFFRDIFTESEVAVSLLQKVQPAVIDESLPLYERLGKVIGFGVEHIRLLASIIEPQEVAEFWENKDILFLQECVQRGVLHLGNIPKERSDIQQWYQQSGGIYKKYFKGDDSGRAFLTFIPNKFKHPRTLHHVTSYIASESAAELTACSFGVVAELIVSGRVNLESDNQKRFISTEAARWNSFYLIEKLLTEAENRLAQDFNYEYAIDYSVINRNFPLCQLLLQYQKDQSMLNIGLLRAANEGRMKFAKYFLEQGADILSSLAEGNALILAAKVNHHSVALWLIEQCPLIEFLNHKDKSNSTAVSYAIAHDNHILTKRLLDLGGCNEDTLGRNPYKYLDITIDYPDVKMLSLLLEYPFFKNALQDDWSRAYDLMSEAIRDQRVDMIELLLKSGARLWPHSNDYRGIGYYSHRKTLLMEAVTSRNAIIAELLLKSGATEEFINEKFKTRSALDMAFEDKNSEMIEILLAYGAKYSPSIYNQTYSKISRIFSSSSQESSLEQAVREHDFGKALQLIESGVVGTTEALETAVASHQAGMVNLILSSGAPLPSKRKRGGNILINAVLEGDILIVKMLLPLMKERLHETDREGRSALQIAQEQGQHDIEALLRESMSQEASVNKNIFLSYIGALSKSPEKKELKK